MEEPQCRNYDNVSDEDDVNGDGGTWGTAHRYQIAITPPRCPPPPPSPLPPRIQAGSWYRF